MASISATLPRLSAEQRRALLIEDEPFIGKPFDVRANPRAIQANTRYMALTLLDTKLEQRASRAAAFAEQLTDTIMSEQVQGPIACSKGCSHCCNTFVSATIPEILNLAMTVRRTILRRDRVIMAAAKSAQIPQAFRESNRIPCPMLEDHACSEYVSRPISCRYLLSKSLETCERIFTKDEGLEFQFADNVIVIRSFAVIMMKTALLLSGLPPQHYELNQALAVALNQDDAEARWLAGEPIFAKVPIDKVDQDTSPISGLVDHLANVIRPTL